MEIREPDFSCISVLSPLNMNPTVISAPPHVLQRKRPSPCWLVNQLLPNSSSNGQVLPTFLLDKALIWAPLLYSTNHLHKSCRISISPQTTLWTEMRHCCPCASTSQGLPKCWRASKDAAFLSCHGRVIICLAHHPLQL